MEIYKKISESVAWEMQQPFLNSRKKREFDITGFQYLRGWDIIKETQLAYLIRGINETFTGSIEQEEVTLWIPKSQTRIFQSNDEEEYNGETLIFVKTWLYNENKSILELRKIKNSVY